MSRHQLPPGVSIEDLLALIEEDDNRGLCMRCGMSTDGCEPDARNLKCDDCGWMEVYGAEEVLLMVAP